MNEKWLIDANSICRGCPSYEDCKGECWSEGECEIYDVLAKAPTLTYADLVPHGRWEVRGQDLFCTNCGGESGYNAFGASAFSDFCPNCGAKMDGGNENE